MSWRGVIVTGTDTGVGKTAFSAALTAATGASYYKPIQSGLEDASDRETIRHLAGLTEDRLLPEAYRLRLPAAPAIAAEHEGIRLDCALLRKLPQATPLVVEGAGGLLVPIDEQVLQIDLFEAWGLPVILCARTALGTINHTLLSLEALASRRIDVLGVAFIGEAEPAAEGMIERHSGVARLGRLPILDPLTPTTLQSAFAQAFDVAAIFAALAGRP